MDRQKVFDTLDAIPQTIAERDRLRAALEAADQQMDYGQYEAAHHVIREALANTSPAPVESVNKELLDTLIEALPYVEMAEHDDAYKPGVVRKMAAKIKAAIAKAEKAGA